MSLNFRGDAGCYQPAPAGVPTLVISAVRQPVILVGQSAVPVAIGAEGPQGEQLGQEGLDPMGGSLHLAIFDHAAAIEFAKNLAVALLHGLSVIDPEWKPHEMAPADVSHEDVEVREIPVASFAPGAGRA